MSLRVKLLRTRMQRDGETLQGGLEPNRAALGVAGIKQFARVGVPERRGDIVDQGVGLLASVLDQKFAGS
jgi:hypothetical protein